MDKAIKLTWHERIGYCTGERMPMIIEHLGSDSEYEASVRYVKGLYL